MDCRAHGDVFFLLDEKFDFDVSLSPPSCSDSAAGDKDEDEVFMGPISHKERCVYVNVQSQLQSGGVWGSWNPLTEDQLDAVCQEAHKLANQLQGGELQGEAPADSTAINNEEFIQDSEAKLGMLRAPSRVLSPIKRETFSVQDSPMRQLPPAVHHQMLRGTTSTGAPASCSRGVTATAPSTHLTAASRLNRSSPVDRAKAPPRSSLRVRNTLGVATVLPNKLPNKVPVAPAASTTSKSRAKSSRLQPPSKEPGGLKRSPSSHRSSMFQSCEDRLSDPASVASDISDSPFHSSLLGKRTLAPPTKSVGVRSVAGVKAPPLQNRRVTGRKALSSSSSSMSSVHSSMSLSPAQGSSLNPSQSGSTGPAPSSVSRMASQSKLRRSTASTAGEPAPSIASRRSLSTRSAKLSEADHAKTTRSPQLKTAAGTPIHPTPSKRPMERTTSIPTSASGRPQSGLKAKSRAEAVALPTLSAGARGIQPVTEVSKVLRPKRLMSLSSIDSLPVKPSAGPLTPSASSSKSLQMKARRPSALPTPVKRRASAIPSPMATNPARTARPPTCSNPDPTPSRIPTAAWQEHRGSPAPTDPQEEEEPVEDVHIQPFCLDGEEVKKEEEEAKEGVEPPAPPTSNTQLPDQTESEEVKAEPSRSESEPSTNQMEADLSDGKTQEVLLLDLPAPALQPQEKLLIDLTNTPNLIRTTSKTCTATQLIDLSSPLIRWSPEDKRENCTPLINLSF